MIPAGLRKGEVEFFVVDYEFRTMFEGAPVEYRHLPAQYHAIVQHSIDPSAEQALDELELTDLFDRHIQWLKCNCGNYDFTPDIAPGADRVQREFIQCNQRGVCVYEGRLCKWILIDGHKVTLTELKVISKIRAGLPDKIICSQLDIALDTLRTHKKSIQRKLGALGKVQITTQAIKYGIS